MIAIQNDSGLTLQLFAEQKLVTELATSWLSDEELPAEFSYPIDCPLNENNKLFVGHGYRPDRASVQTVMAVTVQMEGVLYRRCQFAYKVQSGKLNGYLKIDSAEVYDRIRKLTLLEAIPDVIKLGNGLNDGYNNLVTSLAVRMKAIAALQPGKFPLTFFPIRNEAMLEDSFDSAKLSGFVRRSYVNYWENGNFKTDSTATAGGYLVVPQFFLWWVLERIMNLAGYRIESDWLAEEENQRLVVPNMTAMAVSGLGQGDPAALLTGHTIVAGMHLPDMTVADFLIAIKMQFSLNYTYNANTRVCTITQFASTQKRVPDINLTRYQAGQYDTDDAVSSGFTVRDLIDSSDELYRNEDGEAITAEPFVIGKGGQEITLRCGTMQLISEPVPGSTTQYWTVPTVRQAGNVLDKLYSLSEHSLDKKGKRKNSFGLKLLTYRGLVTHSAGNIYPYATPGVRDGLQQVVGSQSLTMNGRYGSWRKQLRAYYYFRDNTRKITQPLLLPVSVLASLKLYGLVQLSLEDQILRSYLIAKVQAEEPGHDGLCKVDLEVLSLPPGLELSEDVDRPTPWLEFTLLPVFTGADIEYGTLSVKAWTTAQKTTPATVNNLAVIVRTKRYHYGNIPAMNLLDYAEYQTTYYVSGTGTLVLDTRYIGTKVEYGPNHSFTNQYWAYSPSIDPSEDYQILRS